MTAPSVPPVPDPSGTTTAWDMLSSVSTLAGAVFTAVAAAAAWKAARSSATTASEARRALALHYQPIVSVGRDTVVRGPEDVLPSGMFDRFPGDGKDLRVAVTFDAASAVADVYLSWSSASGAPNRRLLREHEAGTYVGELTGVPLVSEGLSNLGLRAPQLVEPVTLSVECRDTVLRRRWSAQVVLMFRDSPTRVPMELLDG